MGSVCSGEDGAVGGRWLCWGRCVWGVWVVGGGRGEGAVRAVGAVSAAGA